MARADRLERLDKRRMEMEAEYTAAFVEALQVTAAGKPGLFAHNGDRHTGAAVLSAIDNLIELGDAIDKAREQLGLPPFDLHQRSIGSRGPVGPQAVGEARQAQAWLEELAAVAAASKDGSGH